MRAPGDGMKLIVTPMIRMLSKGQTFSDVVNIRTYDSFRITNILVVPIAVAFKKRIIGLKSPTLFHAYNFTQYVSSPRRLLVIIF